MSRKDYIALADALARSAVMSRQSETNPALLFDGIVSNIAYVLARDNDRFDTCRFRQRVYKPLTSAKE